MYTGSVVFKNILSKQKYRYFLYLVTAIRILCDKDIYNKYLDYAESLLRYFVEKYAIIYGNQFISYNVHNLVHLANDVRLLGNFDTFSAFRFENCLFKLKNKLKNNGRPLEQVTDLILEQMELTSTLKIKIFPQMHYKNNEINKLTFKHYTITTKSPDNCVLMPNGRLGVIRKIYLDEELMTYFYRNIFLSEICCFEIVGPYFTEPCDSRMV